jgi:hypothetical protein
MPRSNLSCWNEQVQSLRELCLTTQSTTHANMTTVNIARCEQCPSVGAPGVSRNFRGEWESRSHGWNDACEGGGRRCQEPTLPRPRNVM